nr:FAD-dependent oxidoreductase [Luteipulveratus halotolerans]
MSVAVVGGSIAGCACAMAISRAGHDVTVLERSDGDLTDRGFGIALPTPLHATLLSKGYLPSDAPALSIPHRLWLTRESSGDGWRELWRQTPQLITCNWGLLWKSLRTNVPDESYLTGRRVTGLRRDSDGRAVVSVEGEPDTAYDLVIGADGHRSVVRGLVEPHAAPAYAGYVAFRGVTPLRSIEHDRELTELLSDTGLTVMYDGGHLIVYAIPDAHGGRLINWVMYAEPPTETEIDPLRGVFAPDTAVDGLLAWSRELAAARLPARINQIITATPADGLGLQPVVDLTLRTSADAPFLLAGDANAVTRPHTGSGATKALQDALGLEEAMTTTPSLVDALKVYDTERNPASNEIVELGRRIGRDQAEYTPDWTTMDAASTAAYVTATWSGQTHYLLPAED